MLHEKLEDYLMKKTKAELIEILSDSLDIMQGYNGRTPSECVILAVGGSYVEARDRSLVYRLPNKHRDSKGVIESGD
jgi:hypothetical protein